MSHNHLTTLHGELSSLPSLRVSTMLQFWSMEGCVLLGVGGQGQNSAPCPARAVPRGVRTSLCPLCGDLL